METDEILKLKKKVHLIKYKIIVDVILILVLIAVGAYIFYNLELFKALDKDVCRLCEYKTNSVCQRIINFSTSFPS